MLKSLWIPNSTDISLEKEASTVSIVLLCGSSTRRLCRGKTFFKQCLFNTNFLVNRIKELHKVTVRIPPDNEKSNLIRIEGDPQGVQEAKKELLELASRMVSTNLSSRARYYKLNPDVPVLSVLCFTGERAYKGPDHWTAFSQSHHRPKRGEDQRSARQIPGGESETVRTGWCVFVVNTWWFMSHYISIS